MSEFLTTIRVPLRWADIDSLNHVNNVRYLEYAAEAQSQLVDAGELPSCPAQQAIGVDVVFHRPLLLTAREVDVSHELGDHQLIQRIYRGDDVFATVTTWRNTDPVPDITGQQAHRIAPRHSDATTPGVVSRVKVFEYMQEARVAYATSIAPEWAAGGFVVANVLMICHGPVGCAREPYDVHAWIDRVGNSSFSVCTQLLGSKEVLASASSILVGFDADRQMSRPFAELERAVLVHAAEAGSRS